MSELLSTQGNSKSMVFVFIVKVNLIDKPSLCDFTAL